MAVTGKTREDTIMDDVDTKTSKVLLAAGLLGAALNLADSVRTRGPLRAATLFVLATGSATFGEILVTGPFKLLRHRTKPRILGVPVSILLLWYNVVCGTQAATEHVLARLPLDAARRREALPPCTALVAASLDLVTDPFGLDAGLWDWQVDGAYAAEIQGNNGHSGVPILNYFGWLIVVMGVVLGYVRIFPDGKSGSRLPLLLLLPQYLASVGWAIRHQRPEYLLCSALFPLMVGLGLKEKS